MNTLLKNFRIYRSFLISSRNVNFRTRDPPDPHFDRKWMLEVCKPVYLPEKTPEYLTCSKDSKQEIIEPHPYDVILSRELKDYVDSSKMMLIYHVNSLTNAERKSIYRSFFLEDLQFQMYNNDVLKLCFEDTKYQAIMKLFEVNNALVFSPEITLNKALKLSKQLNDKILLLAGVIEDRLFSTSQLNEINQAFKRNLYGEMLCHLRSPALNIHRSLNYPVNLLSHIVKQISKGEDK